MLTVLLGAVGSTKIVLQEMQRAGHPPALLATLPPDAGPRRHADYVDLSQLTGPETEIVHIFDSNDPDFVARIGALAPDIIFVIGWSQIVGPAVRGTARRHCVGFHPTKLPALRGRAAIGWTLLLGVEETGASLFELGEGADDGALLAQECFAIDPRENVASLFAKLSDALRTMLRDVLPRLASGQVVAWPQSREGISYCARRTADDSRIDWQEGAATIDRLIRASSAPYAGAFTFTRRRQVTIWAAEPYGLPWPYHAAAGQIVDYIDGNPIVRCGDGCLLRLTRYDAGDGALTGQVRFRDQMDNEEGL